MRLTLVLPLLLLASCASPESADLLGSWANQDGTTWRAFTFLAVGADSELAGLPNAYSLALYEDGAAPAEVQRGTFSVDHDVDVNTPNGVAKFNDVLTTTVTWSVDGTGVGTTFGDPFYAFSTKRFTIRSGSAASGERTFDKVDTLP